MDILRNGFRTLSILSLLLCACASLTFAQGHTQKFGVTPSAPTTGTQRAFVSVQHGSDGNTASLCSPTLPCRTFNAALTVVNSGGEVVALDSGGYGPTTITKAVSITAPPGVYAALTSASGDGITVNAANADVVTLRGLTITGIGGVEGITINSAGAVHIEDCVISGFIDSGISDQSTTAGENLFIKDSLLKGNFYGLHYAPTNGGSLFVTDTSFRKNRGIGLFYRPVGGGNASISHSRMEGNRVGMQVGADPTAKATVNDSVASGNTNQGFQGFAGELNIENCAVAGNGSNGVEADGGAIVRISNSVVTNNAFGLFVFSGSTLASRRNNTIEGNGNGNAPGGFGTVTTITPQ